MSSIYCPVGTMVYMKMLTGSTWRFGLIKRSALFRLDRHNMSLSFDSQRRSLD